MEHSPRFLNLVNDALKRVRVITPGEIRDKLEKGDDFHLLDVREESEWEKSRIPRAVHLGKGILERDIEKRISDPQAEIVLYCGGGFRSALAADNLQKMGYTRVRSLLWGFRGWVAEGYPIE